MLFSIFGVSIKYLTYVGSKSQSHFQQWQWIVRTMEVKNWNHVLDVDEPFNDFSGSSCYYYCNPQCTKCVANSESQGTILLHAIFANYVSSQNAHIRMDVSIVVLMDQCSRVVYWFITNVLSVCTTVPFIVRSHQEHIHILVFVSMTKVVWAEGIWCVMLLRHLTSPYFSIWITHVQNNKIRTPEQFKFTALFNLIYFLYSTMK